MWICVLGVASLACSDVPRTPEETVRAFVLEAEGLAERKEVADLKELVDESYSDAAGRDRKAIHDFLTFHFLRNANIYLLTRVSRVSFPAPDRAEVLAFLAMAGEPIAGPEALAGIRASLYRLELELVDRGEGDWRLLAATWRPARRDDFL